MDDTDSLQGGCTTEVLFQLLEQLPEHVEVLHTRLVRLWPFAQQRTRGNAAVAAELKTENTTALLEFLNDFWMRSILPLKGEVQPSEHSERPQYPSDPGMVWFEDVKPDAEFYRKGLTTEIYEKDLPTATKSWGGHGKIGATLAVHWPAKRSTYEAIAWRVSENNGKRRLDKEAIKFIDEMDGTFLCRDQRSGSSMVAPRGKSPVLFGVRAWNKQAAEEALQRLITGADTEAVAGWMVFETNQATNDHLETATEATIEEIEILKGGHTLLHSSEDRFLAFKETGEISSTCQRLQPGDVIRCKGMRAPDESIHVEFMQIRHLVPERRRPLCPTCSKALTSMGKNQGLRCKKCGLKVKDAWEETQRTLPKNRWIQPPPSSRRHLAKPLDEFQEWQNNL